MPQNVYELLWIFLIYAVLGWCTEVCYAALDRGIFVNRGFLNGPYCPIYGCGVTIVIVLLTPLKDNLFLLFAGSFFLTSVLEYMTGFILEKVFHNKWWDYSGKPFNIRGYVCLKFSICWGFACTFVMDIFHPMVYKAITFLPSAVGMALLIFFMAIFMADCVITVMTILNFNKRLRLMNDMAVKIHKLSDEIGENLYEGVAIAVEKSEEFQETHEQLLTKISDTKEKFAESTDTVKAKLAESTAATKGKLAESTDTVKAKLAESTAATKGKLAESTDTVKAKLAESTAATKGKLAESTDTVKERFAEKTEAAREKFVAYKENHEGIRLEKLREKEELERKYKELFSRKNFGFKRLMKAFPDMTSREQNESLQRYKKYFNIRHSKGQQDNKTEKEIETKSQDEQL